MRSLQQFNYSGYSALKYVVEQTYGSLSNAIGGLTLFSHPDTVRQTNNRALFRVIRNDKMRGKEKEDSQVWMCDNTSPKCAFRWANNLPNDFGKDYLQFNHIYNINEPDYYTSLANICVTPSYIAKLTDSDPATRALLEFRIWDIYGFVPNGITPPTKPSGYDLIQWVPFLPPVEDIGGLIEARMKKGPKSTPAKSAAKHGWLFSKDFPAPSATIILNSGQ